MMFNLIKKLMKYEWRMGRPYTGKRTPAYKRLIIGNFIKEKGIDASGGEPLEELIHTYFRKETAKRCAYNRKMGIIVIRWKKKKGPGQKDRKQAIKRGLTVEYVVYINSREWQLKRKEAFAFHGKMCHNCGAVQLLEVHHLHYRNLFNEKMEDLRILCVGCHKIVHRKKFKVTKVLNEQGKVIYRWKEYVAGNEPAKSS